LNVAYCFASSMRTYSELRGLVCVENPWDLLLKLQVSSAKPKIDKWLTLSRYSVSPGIRLC
jgi:hypothetical protein